MRLSAAQEKVVRAAEKGLFVRTTGGMYDQWYVCKEYGSLVGAERVQLRTVESVRLHRLVEDGPRITMDMHSYRLTDAGRAWLAENGGAS